MGVLLPLLLLATPAAGGGRTLSDFLGVTYLLDSDAATAATPRGGAEIGLKWVRDLEVSGFAWGTVQNASGAAFDWSKPDAALVAAQANGQVALPIVAYTAEWARSPGPKGCQTAATNTTQWEQYVTQLARRYVAKGVTHFQIWNEPGWNNNPFFCGSEASFVLVSP